MTGLAASPSVTETSRYTLCGTTLPNSFIHIMQPQGRHAFFFYAEPALVCYNRVNRDWGLRNIKSSLSKQRSRQYKYSDYRSRPRLIDGKLIFWNGGIPGMELGGETLLAKSGPLENFLTGLGYTACSSVAPPYHRYWLSVHVTLMLDIVIYRLLTVQPRRLWYLSRL